MSKVLFAVLAICLMSISSYAQTGFNYKALIKDTNGNVLSNQEIDIRFTVQTLEGPVFIASYQERHSTTTDSNGIAIVTIGEGEIITGSFPNNFWLPNITLNTEIDIERDGTFVDFGESNFKKVPMAIHADNVFSGDYNDLTNQPTITVPSGLEKISESIDPDTNLPIYGWRLAGSNPDYYANIGRNAVDLSYNNSTFDASLNGAMGDNSTTIGVKTNAQSYAETAIGSYNLTQTPNSTSSWVQTDKLFSIGNGFRTGNIISYSDAFRILKNGTITAPSFSITQINTAGDKALITKEYADTNYLNINGHVDGPLTIQNASDATSTWRLETRPNGSLSMYRNGSYRGFFSESTGNYSSISDRRTKKDITSLENGTLNKVMQLNPVSYVMKDQKDTKRNLGLISQEVQKIFPSITNYVEEADLITLSYTELIPVLIKALQEQQGIIDGQNNLIETITADNSLLKEKDITQDKSIEALVTRLNLIESKSSN
ncbi:tail fiber domain-containing protein [Winogradskyella sp. F6397]|uniref:Tail fiber domain-containing protein n=1 Tax=Winogradskyella marina TaxID=2785530 RepID=A0ABS0EKG5_9FLAO|nr:tail fiber domain-containing protein [Winogradskyella marina]MBF8150872.1 tail fiber domain-containing protein [Winogradskyella marina]